MPFDLRWGQRAWTKWWDDDLIFQIVTSPTSVLVSNDGATILKNMSVLHPCAKMLVELSEAQDAETGDGTTSVVVIAGALLNAAEGLLAKGIHPTVIAESFLSASRKAVEALEAISVSVDLSDRALLVKSAATSLNSKIVSQLSPMMSAVAVDSILRVADLSIGSVDLSDIRIVKKLGCTLEDLELMDLGGLLLTQSAVPSAGGPLRMEKAKIGLVQFQLSPPKTDMESQVVVTDYRQIDKILKEEREYLLNICKKIKKANCNVLLVQKSILRDALSEMALHFLSKLKIMVISDIERDEIDFIAKTLGCKPIADISSFTEDKLGSADLVEEISMEGVSSRYVRIGGIKNGGKTASVLVRGASQVVLDEAERSLHDALCVLRCLVRKRQLIAGGGSPESYLSYFLSQWATHSLSGKSSMCVDAYAQALDVVPITLSENAGLDPIAMVTELRNRHAKGESNCGINIRKVLLSSAFIISI